MKYYIHGYFLVKTSDFENFEYFDGNSWAPRTRVLASLVDRSLWRSLEELLDMYKGDPENVRYLVEVLV